MAILDPDLQVWPGMTVEERAAYDQSVALGDSEFETNVVETLGPLGREYVDADKANTILYKEEPKELAGTQLGMHVQKELRDDYQEGRRETFDYVVDKPALKKAFGRAGLDPAEELEPVFNTDDASIFTFGAAGASPATQSHEFRHLAIDAFKNIPLSSIKGDSKKAKALRYIQKNMPSDATDERWNRQFDMYRGVRPEFLYDEVSHEMQKSKYKGSIYEVLNPALDAVVKRFKSRGEKFAKLEAAAQVYEGVPAPKGTTWAEHYFKQFLVRHKKLVAAFKKDFNKQYDTDVFKVN